MSKEKTELSETLDQITDDVKDFIPSMNVSMPEVPQKKELVSDEQLNAVYDEIANNLREERQFIDEVLHNFADMVLNGGDSSNSSKETLLGLINAKLDASDKLIKVADLKTRIKLKDLNTFKPYLSAKQDNKTTINIGGDKRQLIEAITKMAKGPKDE